MTSIKKKKLMIEGYKEMYEDLKNINEEWSKADSSSP